MSRAFAFLILVAGCGGGGVTFVDPPPPPPPAPFSLKLKPIVDDVPAAQTLGWANGIPDADVTLTPKDSSAAPRTAKSSASGTVDLGMLTPGNYLLEATRWLTPAEVARLPAGQDVDGWVIKQLITVTAQGGELPVAVLASRRKGLVISEWAFNVAALPPVNETYYYGGFVELYNNTDSTAYLDGLTIVEGLVWGYDYLSDGCASLTPYSSDPDGIWTRHVQQFPGRGRDYPVPPGESVVIAVDAIDHSKIIQGGLDLSQADFEFWGGPGDVDNPAVPNMIDTLSVGSDLTGHGPFFEYLGSVIALARPYSPATAARVRLGGDKEWARVNGDLILDVMSTWSGYVAAQPRCPQLVNARFDRASFDRTMIGRNENAEFLQSVSRQAIPGTSGRVILQWTRSSAVDFRRTLRTPGVVP